MLHAVAMFARAGQCYIHVGEMLHTCRGNIGCRGNVACWSNVACMLEQFYMHIGAMLHACWSNVTCMLEQCYMRARAMLHACWSIVTCMLDHNVTCMLDQVAGRGNFTCMLRKSCENTRVSISNENKANCFFHALAVLNVIMESY